MAQRSDLPRLQGSKPTFFNSTGSLFGLLAGGLGALVTNYLGTAPFILKAAVANASPIINITSSGIFTAAAAVPAITIAAPLVIAAAAGLGGYLLGGFLGKTRMKHQLATGVEVKEPGILNRGLVNGLFIGAAALLALAAAPSVLPALGVGAASMPGWIGTALGSWGIMSAIAAVPAVVGSFLRYSEQVHIYNAASHEADIMQITRQAEQARAKGLEKVMERASASGVTPEDTAQLNERMRGGEKGNKSFVADIAASRQMADAALAK